LFDVVNVTPIGAGDLLGSPQELIYRAMRGFGKRPLTLVKSK
jgi:hypothetical protein